MNPAAPEYKAPEGKAYRCVCCEVQLHSFKTSALDGMNGQLHYP
jgi:hypothetical protein